METSTFYRDLEAFEKAWGEANRSEDAESRDARIPLESPWMRFFHVQGAAGGVLTRNNDAIDATVRSFGLFCRVSTVPCSAREALTPLRTVPLMAGTFARGRLLPEITDTRDKDNQVRLGRFFVAFVALSIAVEIDARLRKADRTGMTGGRKSGPLTEAMAWEEVKNRLSTPRIAADGKR